MCECHGSSEMTLNTDVPSHSRCIWQGKNRDRSKFEAGVVTESAKILKWIGLVNLKINSCFEINENWFRLCIIISLFFLVAKQEKEDKTKRLFLIIKVATYFTIFADQVFIEGPNLAQPPFASDVNLLNVNTCCRIHVLQHVQGKLIIFLGGSAY